MEAILFKILSENGLKSLSVVVLIFFLIIFWKMLNKRDELLLQSIKIADNINTVKENLLALANNFEQQKNRIQSLNEIQKQMEMIPIFKEFISKFENLRSDLLSLEKDINTFYNRIDGMTSLTLKELEKMRSKIENIEKEIEVITSKISHIHEEHFPK